MDPVKTPGVVDANYATSAKANASAADENALRLLTAWCNIDGLREAYRLQVPGALSNAPRCVALREYLEKIGR